jgi:MFS family permease
MNRVNPFRIREGLPVYSRGLLLFQALNAVNFTIALGAPMVLTARYLGADESIVGLLISLTPFLATLQIFGANIADRWGYRKLMVVGWASRAFMLLPAIAAPLLIGRVAPGILIWIFFAALFAFNAIRGVSGCAWFPWLKMLIPEEGRGYYLGLEQRVINFCVLITLIVAGSILSGTPAGWHYSIVFCLSWAAGIYSAFILAKVPDQRPSDVSNREPLDLRAMRLVIRRIWAHKPYRRIIRFGVLHSFAYMAFPGFLVLYLRNGLGWSDGVVLIVSSALTFGIMLTAVAMGQLSDRAGSRPLMRLATLGMMGF